MNDARRDGGAEEDGAGDAVVVPGIASPSSVTCVRSLGRRGVAPVVVGGPDPSAAARSKHCRERHAAPSPYDDLSGYRAVLERLARRPDVATVVPLREVDIHLLARHRGAFGEHVATPWPDFETVRRAQDWLALREAAAAADVPVPETRLLTDWDDWDRPTVVKSRYSILVDEQPTVPGMYRFGAGADPDTDAIVEEMGHVPIVQEHVPGGPEHGFFALYDDGDPVARFQHRRVRSYSYAGGASVYRESVDRSDLDALGSRLLSELDWHGPAMVEFRRDERDGRPKLMEINPRFWGSLALPVHAGVDFPRRYYRLAVGRPLPPTDDYAVGVGSHLLRGELSYLLSVCREDHAAVERPPLARALADVAASTVAQPNFDVLDAADPVPFAADVVHTARDGLAVLREALRR